MNKIYTFDISETLCMLHLHRVYSKTLATSVLFKQRRDSFAATKIWLDAILCFVSSKLSALKNSVTWFSINFNLVKQDFLVLLNLMLNYLTLTED